MSTAPRLASEILIALDIIEQFFRALRAIFEFFGIPIPGEQ